MSVLDKVINCYENITPFQTAMVVSAIVMYILYILFLRDIGQPPGPIGLPLIEYWPFIKADTCHLHLQELAKKYGDVFSFRAARNVYIHLGSIKAIREAHITNSDCFTGRVDGYSIFNAIFGDGIVGLNGEPWKVLRKFFVSKFKEYGMNAVKENASRSVYDAMKETVQDLNDSKSRPIHITDVIVDKCSLILRRIMFNDQGITKEELIEMNNIYGKMMVAMNIPNAILVGSLSKYFILPFLPSVRMLHRNNNQLEAMLFDVINRHKAENNESQIANLIDCYFKERNNRKQKGDSTAQYFTDKALVSTLSQILTDGISTVSVFIGNFLLTLVQYPEEQDKIYEEIREVIGTERLPALEDKNKLPYVNAFISEVTRYTDFFPLFPSLQSTKETRIHGYKIPKGSITLMNIYAAHRNPNDFENPDEFNPSRYLPPPGKSRPELPILFGIGKRSCIGEAFSMIQAFLFLTTIVQNFRLTVPEGSPVSSVAFWSSDKIEICAHPRSHTSNLKVNMK